MRASSIGAIGASGLALAAILATHPARAQQRNWRASSRMDDWVAFIDIDSITRDGDRVRFWREIRMNEPLLSEGARYDRVGAHMEIDCRARTFRNLEVYIKLGERTLVSDTGGPEIEAIGPGTLGDANLRSVCLNDWPR